MRIFLESTTVYAMARSRSPVARTRIIGESARWQMSHSRDHAIRAEDVTIRDPLANARRSAFRTMRTTLVRSSIAVLGWDGSRRACNDVGRLAEKAIRILFSRLAIRWGQALRGSCLASRIRLRPEKRPRRLFPPPQCLSSSIPRCRTEANRPCPHWKTCELSLARIARPSARGL